MKPAIIPGMSWADYRAIDAHNFSTIKLLDVSPKHYQHNRRDAPESDAMRLGEAAHCAVLEPRRFPIDYAIWDRRTESGRLAPRHGQYYKAFLEENRGKKVLTEDQQTDALTMQLAVSACAEAMEYLLTGQPEVTLVWSIGKLLCKGRVDWITDLGEGPVLVGLKTCADIRLDQFSRAAGRLLYHVQWPFYADGYKAITGKYPHEIVEIVVEKKPPHDVIVYVIGDDVLKVGRLKYRELLQKLQQCELDKRWPGVGGGSKQPFMLPSYMYDDEIYGDE